MKKIVMMMFSALVALCIFSTAAFAQSDDEAPDIRTQFDVNNMSKYSDSDLSKPVTLTNFYVKEIHKDKIGEYHYLLTPKKNSTQYFLLVSEDKVKKARTGHKVTIDGTLNGKGNVNMGYKTSPYQHKPAILFLDD